MPAREAVASDTDRLDTGGSPPNKALQLTPSSSIYLIRGRFVATGARASLLVSAVRCR